MDFSEMITFATTADLERADAFYRGKLGLRLVADQGACRIYHVGGNAYLGLCRSKDGRAPTTGGMIITFVSADVERRYAELSERGVVFESEPKFNADYNITHCFLRDPDGRLLEIQRFEDSQWRPGRDVAAAED